MTEPVFLLGAGASIDAGLSDSNRLTKQIYDRLDPRRSPQAHQIFGYVISKVITRKVKAGHSPFDPVNVEEVYDALDKLLNRSDDIVSEFVSGWDPFLSAMTPAFDKHRFKSTLERVLNDTVAKTSSRGHVPFRGFHIDDLVTEIEKLQGSQNKGKEQVNQILMRTLLSCLEYDPSRISYVKDLVSVAKRRHASIASLNYDLIVEDAAGEMGLSVDYGLERWNAERIAMIGKDDEAQLRLIKLHGSLNWFGGDESIVISREQSRALPLMVFGNSNAKMRHDGPFLQLRHEFERKLLDSNEFIVVGYAFADEHLNSIIRRWVSTRQAAKMIIVDPGNVPLSSKALGKPYITVDGRINSKTVDITHIKKTASNSVSHIEEVLSAPIDLSVDRERNGYVPNVLFRTIE